MLHLLLRRLEGLKKYRLSSFLKPIAADTVTGKSRKLDVRLCSLSEQHSQNEDSDENSTGVGRCGFRIILIRM